MIPIVAACEKTVWHTEICFQIKLPLFNERFCIMFLIFYSLQEHLVPALRDRSQRQSSRPFKQKPQKSWRSCCSNRRLRPTIILFSSASVCHHCHSTKSVDFYCNGLVAFFWFFCKQSIVVIAYMCGVFYHRTITTWRYFWRHVFPEAQFIDNHSRDAAVTETRNCYTWYVQSGTINICDYMHDVVSIVLGWYECITTLLQRAWCMCCGEAWWGTSRMQWSTRVNRSMSTVSRCWWRHWKRSRCRNVSSPASRLWVHENKSLNCSVLCWYYV